LLANPKKKEKKNDNTDDSSENRDVSSSLSHCHHILLDVSAAEATIYSGIYIYILCGRCIETLPQQYMLAA
jgi:hypothetical protein